jgi:hypothetical protein
MSLEKLAFFLQNYNNFVALMTDFNKVIMVWITSILIKLFEKNFKFFIICLTFTCILRNIKV